MDNQPGLSSGGNSAGATQHGAGVGTAVRVTDGTPSYYPGRRVGISGRAAGQATAVARKEGPGRR